MPLIADPQYTQTAVTGSVNSGLFIQESAPQKDPSTLDVLAAASRQSTLAGAAYERIINHDPDMPDTPPGWDALDHIQGYEDYASDLADAQTPSDLQGRLTRIKSMQEDREVLQRAGFGGVGAELGFALVDPSFYVAAAVPEIAIAKSVRLGKTLTAAARGAAGTAGYEAGLQQLQDARSPTESLFNVAGGALLSGVLGHLLHRAPEDLTKPIREAIDDELVRSEAGAAAVSRPTTLGEESIASGAKNLSKAMSKAPMIGTDLDRIMASDSVTARTALQDLADVPQILEKNKAGIATPNSVEAAVARHDARVADFMDLAREQWALYRNRMPSSERMSKGDFYASIASASRRDDTIGIAEIDQAARFLRSKVFDPLKDEAMKLGLMKDPVKDAQAVSDTKAIGAYVKAESSQIYSNYAARILSAIKDKSIDLAQVIKGKTRLEGQPLESASAAAAVRAELERAIDLEKSVKERSYSGIEQKLNVAQADFDKQITALRSAREMNAKAMTDELADAQKMASKQTGRKREDLNDRIALALGVEKQIQNISIDKAEEAFEVANRELQKEQYRIQREVKAGSRREPRIRARLKLEKAARVRDNAVSEARQVFIKRRGDLSREHGIENIKAAHRASSKKDSLREVYAYARKLERLKSSLKDSRLSASGERKIEISRYREAVTGLRNTAGKELEKLEPISQRDFRKRAKRSIRRNEPDENSDVQKLVKLLRDKDAGKLSDRVPLKKVDPERFKKPLGAESYFRRMYDRSAIRANLSEWHEILFKHFSNAANAEPAEIKAAVEDVTKNILHADVGQANFSTKVMVSAAGPLKERTLDVPDALIEKFLINDPTRVARAYVRDLAPQVEIAKRFGDVEMKEKLQSISDEYNILREKARQKVTDPKKLSKKLETLTSQEKDTLEALVRVRDRVLGRAGRLGADSSEGVRRTVMASRGWRNLVASARLGGTALTGGLMDTAKIAATYGFLPTVNKLTQLATSSEFRALSKSQARRVGSAVEAALSRRVQVAYDGAITEGWTQKLADGVYKYTGLNHITDFNRTLAATLFEDTVLKASGKISEGKALPAFTRTRLASLGLGDDELKAIAAQIEKHGGEVDGIRVSGSADWTDKNLADIYDAAILKESKIAVQQPGAADRVWWMDKETGKLIGQLKTFSLSAPTRLLSGGLQMAGHGEYARAARFFGFMMIGGYLTHALRQTVAGKNPVSDPQTAAFEAFTESGIGGVFPDVLSPLGRRLGMFGESVRYSDRNAMSAYGGPALGALNDTYDFAFNRTQGGMSARDLHMLRRMLPWNQVWWLRREINALEGELAEGFGLEGADSSSFAERALRTDAMFASGQRGGTGTGLVQ